jgi:hypothetical protein
MKKTRSKPSEVVLVLGVPFTINYKADIKDDRETLAGTCERTKHIINISTRENETQEQLESTLLHEILHGILYVSGHHAVIADEDKEEALVLALENGIGQLYKRVK